MAFYRSGGGGSATETVLWTNPSPSSTFSEQRVQLSQSMENFDFIKVTFITTHSNPEEGAIIVPISVIMKSLNSTNNSFRCCLGARISGANYARPLFIDSGVYDKLGISTASRLGASGTYNSELAPLEVIGIKEA